jgi:ketosteroid isomerase-like protein
MRITRRESAVLAAAGLLSGGAALAAGADQQAVEAAVEALRLALLKRDKAVFVALLDDALSYGHSDGHVEGKARFIEVVAGGLTLYKSATISDGTTVIAGDAAIARHLFAADVETDGKAASVRLHVLQVWRKQGADWKLLARQGFRT